METIELLKNKIMLFNDFLIELGMPKDLFIETNKLVEKAYLEKNIKILKSADSDINSQLKHMPLKNLILLKKRFKEKLDLDLDNIEKQFDKTIQKVIKRNKINNEDEYRILLDRMGDTTIEKEKNEIDKINDLLIDYHKKI